MWVGGADGKRFPALDERAGSSRHSNSEPAKTVGLSNERVIVLDQLRKKRNLSDYTGEGVSDEQASACVRAAEDLATTVEQWLRANHPELMGDFKIRDEG